MLAKKVKTLKTLAPVGSNRWRRLFKRTCRLTIMAPPVILELRFTVPQSIAGTSMFYEGATHATTFYDLQTAVLAKHSALTFFAGDDEGTPELTSKVFDCLCHAEPILVSVGTGGSGGRWMKIHVDALERHLEVRSTDTVAHVKTMINGKAPEQLRLFFQYKLLEDDHTLLACGLSDASTAVKCRRPDEPIPTRPVSFMSIFVKTLTGRVYEFEVAGSQPIWDVKVQIYNEYGVPPHELRLIFAGHELEEGHTLSDYGVEEKSTLDLLLRLRGGGPGIDFVDVSDTDALLGVRGTLARRTGVLPTRASASKANAPTRAAWRTGTLSYATSCFPTLCCAAARRVPKTALRVPCVSSRSCL
eukprot:m.5699 g.5699  ORF g.5699 m.5699 type:complete len:359 (-) comp2441_c0_seq2:414-1490(-)